MSYENKHLIDGSAPDDFDLDKCPVYQKYLADLDKARIKEQIKGVVDHEFIYEAEQDTKRA